MYINFFPIHIRQLGGNDYSISLITSIPLFFGILALPGGILSDFIDRKKIMLFGWAVTIPAPLIWAFADKWEWLLIGQIIYSLSLICAPTMTIYIFEYESSCNKMLAYSSFIISGTISTILGPVIGGRIIDHYGAKTLYIILFLLYVLSTLCLIPVSKQRNSHKKQIMQYLEWENIIGNYSVKKLLIVTLFLAVLSLFQNIAG